MNRIAIDLGFVQIYWYSICIILGMMVGMYVVLREAKRHNIGDTTMTNLIFNTIIAAIIGARLYYVIFNWGYYSRNFIEVFEIWQGGLAIHGAIITGGAYLYYYTKKHSLDILTMLDICSVGLIIGQAFGRWGNFFNQEAHGGEVTLEHLQSIGIPKFISDGMLIDGKYYEPTFLYESIWCIFGFVLLLIIRRRKYIKTGQMFGFYCVWYSAARFFIEGMRTDSLMLGGMRMAQLVSVAMFGVGLFFFIRRFKSGRFDHLYNQDVVYQQDSQSNDKKGILGNKNKKNFTKTKSNPKEVKAEETNTANGQKVEENVMPNSLTLPKSNVAVNPNISDSIPLGPQAGNAPKKKMGVLDLMAAPQQVQQAPQQQAMPQPVQQQPVMPQQPQMVQQPVQQPVMPQQPATVQQVVPQQQPLGNVVSGMPAPNMNTGNPLDLPLINQNPTNNTNNNPQGPSITGF